MAYSFRDAESNTFPGPCINGWRQVKALMSQYKDWPRPALEQLVQHGYTNQLTALSVECIALAKKTTDKDIKATLASLAAIARKADEIVVLET